MPTKQTLKELDRALSAELEGMREKTLVRASRILRREDLSLQSFHAIIGGKNNTYVDAVRDQFGTFETFWAKWLRGLRERAESDLARQKKYGEVRYSTGATNICALMGNNRVRKYIKVFLERNFYRNIRERTRFKPGDELWRVWFGQKKSCWGLLIAPVFRDGEWTNDKSEMRRAEYDYWTVGHLVSTGLVDPDREKKPYKVPDLDAILDFYRSILTKASDSKYEKGVLERYACYLESSDAPLDEPLLIPELRYAGLERKHKYRLDYSVLNAHTGGLVGFELSPSSTHMSLKGKKKKTQKALNAELAEKWEYECDKRKAYFKKFGIPVITFTDRDLQDLDACFARIQEEIQARAEEVPDVDAELEAVAALGLVL